jgi:hypothetical protein
MFEKAMQIKPGPKPESLDSSFDNVKRINASTGTSKAPTAPPRTSSASSTSAGKGQSPTPKA